MIPNCRAAIYARVSSEQQVEKSGLEVQITECRRYAAEMGYEVCEVFKDEGISGAHRANHRAGLDRMLAGARQGEFQFLLVHELDRLARELGVGMGIVGAVAESGIRLVEVSTRTSFDDHGALQGLVKLWAAGEDRKKILQRTKRGQIERAKKGLMSGPSPLGFDKDATGHLIINEEEAALVRRIFHLYLNEGHNLDSLATLLNNEGIKTKRAKLNEAGRNRYRGANRWQRSTIQCVLKNPIYRGEYLYGKTRGRVPVGQEYQASPKKPLTKAYLETAIKNRAFLPHEVVSIAVPPILDEETWKRAQAQLADRSKRMRERQGKAIYPYLFDGIVRCADCGRLVTRTTIKQPVRKDGTHKTVAYYTCRNQENACPNVHKHHRMDAIDSQIIARLLPYLANPERVREGLSDLLSHKAEEQANLVGKASTIEHRIQAIGIELQRLRQGYLGGVITMEEFKVDRETRDSEIARLEGDLAAVRKKLSELAYEDDLARVEKVVATLSRLGSCHPLEIEWLTAYLDGLEPPSSPRDMGPLGLLPTEEAKESLILMVQTLVKRVMINRAGELDDYALRIPEALPPGDPDGSVKGDYKANLKCMTSPSFTS